MAADATVREDHFRFDGMDYFRGRAAAVQIGDVGEPRAARAHAQASKTLVKATLEAWNPTLDHLLNSYSDPVHSDPLTAPKGVFNAPVIVN